MFIIIFISIVVLAFVGLRSLETSSKKHSHKTNKNSVYDLSGKNYLL